MPSTYDAASSDRFVTARLKKMRFMIYFAGFELSPTLLELKFLLTFYRSFFIFI